MTSEQYQRLKEVFLAVCDLPADQHDAAATQLCGNDQALLAEVQSLLQSHRQAAEASGITPGLELPPQAVQTESDSADEAPQPSTKKSVSHGASHTAGGSRNEGGTTTVKGRFESGTVLAERYRIISLLGIGGMGEVYRAEDLTLDQPVALKFLPPSYESDPAWLERFHNEVRLSRQVTHPNVCRVFDLGQVGGEQFISMEFVDGEDLASLLRRIGRLPRDKAIQIARQLCAGLAAAHERGVLHRDLKPANVMLDGRGQVRITDFGISGRADDGRDAASGTPAYMAPEQFTSGQATVRSDIYSLGLVLYEIFTGHPAFSAHSMPEYARLHRQSSPTHPSTIIEDMDPLVERVILRCLEKDPGKRPGSALAVSAALPGGDPLAAALAAGETPSPEMVAAAGETTAMSLLRAGVLLGLTLVGLIAVVLFSPRAALLPRIHDLTSPPQVLVDRAHGILASIGYTDAPRSKALGFALDDQYIGYVQAKDFTRTRWDELAGTRPGAVRFWLRQSPKYMLSTDEMISGQVTLEDPPLSVPGMRTVIVDVLGQLKELDVLPLAGKSVAPAAPATVDFAPLFKAANLDQADFVPLAPSPTPPPMFADYRCAWSGHYPENPHRPITIEAASFQGRPVYFKIIESWQNGAAPAAADDLPTGRNIILQATLILVAICSAVLLAWHNVRAGRVDSAGAQKLSGLFLILGILIWLLSANHVPEMFMEMRQFLRVLGVILVPAAIVWMFYLALEPYVRRIWPESVISWSRLMAGRLTDPLVAGHVLIGLAVAVAATLLGQLANVIPMWFGHAAAIPNINALIRFLAKENPSAVAILSLLEALYMGLLYLLSLVLFRLVLRRRWLASAAFVLLVAALAVQTFAAGWLQWLQASIVAGLILLLIVRFGLVATLAGMWGINFLRIIPITSDMTVWYASQTRFAVGLLIVVSVAATALATGQWRRGEKSAAVIAGARTRASGKFE